MADPLESLATGLHQELGRPFTWDGGMGTALLTFESSDTDAVVAVVGRHLANEWNSDTIDDAPSVVSDLISGLGGLRPGQWVMHSEATGPFLVAVFWPWGGGSPISLRVGVVGGGDDADAKLKSWMGIA
jgi:hypothetical protein